MNNVFFLHREKRIEVPGEAVTVTVIEDAFSECNVSLVSMVTLILPVRGGGG